MAYTLVQTPAAFSSFNSPLWHVVNSDNNIEADFRYILQVYVMGSLAPVATLRITPDDNGDGIVDVSRVVRSYVVNYFILRDPTFSPFTIDTDDIRIDYTVFYGEEFSTAGVFDSYPGLTSSSHTTFNNYASDTPGASPFTTIGTRQHEWLTDRDITRISMPRSQTHLLSYFNPDEQDLEVQIQEIDEDGNTVGPFARSEVLGGLNRLVVLNLNLAYLNAMDFAPGSAPINPDAIGYVVIIISDSGATFSDPAIVRFMCEAKVDATTLHFLNMHGGFDSYAFSSPTRKSVDFERRAFEKAPTLTSDLDTVRNYHVAHDWSRKLDSGFVDDTTHEWLWQLVASPQVYLEKGGVMYPVVIKSQRWSEKLTRFDKMYNLEIEIQMGRKVVSQIR